MKELEKKLYSFSGAVLKFGTILCNRWEASTIATSEKKAANNLKYRFRKEFGLIASVPIELVGKFILK